MIDHALWLQSELTLIIAHYGYSDAATSQYWVLIVKSFALA